MAASAADAHPYPIYNARYRVVFPILDADGDLVTAAASLDSELSQDQGTFADATNEATEIATSSGMYYLDLIATELDTRSTAIIVKTATAGAKTTPMTLYPKRLPVIRTGTAQAGAASTITLDSGASANDDFYVGCIVNITNDSPAGVLGQARFITDYVGSTKVATIEGTWGTNPSSASTFEVLLTEEACSLVAWAGQPVSDPNSNGHPKVDLSLWKGTVPNNLVSARVDASVGAMATDVITAAAIANGAIDAATFAAGAIDGAALAASAGEKILQAVTGTADSGSTTTIVDAERTEADTDYWRGSWVLITSGTAIHQIRRITAFNPATDTITFAPPLTQAISTNTYTILRSSAAEILVDAIKASAIDAASIATAAITAAKFAAGAIDAAAIATGAIDADSIAADAITAAKVADGTIDAATFAAGAINAAAIATGAIDADALAADAVDEFWDEAMTEIAAVPAVTASFRDALRYMFLFSRNKLTQTATTQLLRNDADAATIATSTLSDDGTTFIRGEFS